MIAVDIDGVIADSGPWLEKEIEERIGKKLVFSNPRTFQFTTEVSDSECNEYIIDALIKYKDDIQMHDKHRTIRAILMVIYLFGEINFVTARPIETTEATHYWLNKNLGAKIQYKLHVLGEYANKRKWMEDNKIFAIIDDRFKTVNSLSSNMQPYLVNRDWNIGRDEKSHVIRVSDMLEAVLHYFNSGGGRNEL